MTETPTPKDTDPTSADELREHPQDPAEGPDEEQEQTEDVPRVHPEEPAEG